MEFIRGQKQKLSDVTSALKFEVGVAVAGPNPSPDLSCFGLDGNGKLSDDRYFIFYNQKSSPCGSLTAVGPRDGDQETFVVDLDKLPATIRRLVFCATIEGNGTMSAISDGHWRIMANGAQLAKYRFAGKEFSQEKAIMVAELYFKDVWRVAASGQGFNGGLSALLAHFGGQEVSTSSPSPPPPPSAPPSPSPQPAPARPTPPPPPASPSPAKVSLSKVSLGKRGDSHTVNLTKAGGTQPIRINLNWQGPQPKKGFLAGLLGGGGSVDLDLGCMFRLVDGEQGVIQPLGNNYGSRTSAPYIFLDKDDRSGSAADGENMVLYRPDLIDLVVVFAMIYEGTANFSTVNARLTLKDQAGNEITVPLNNPESSLRFCAVAAIRKDAAGIRVIKEERYVPSHKECDEHFGFGFRWVAGQK